ncbi:MAG TPA: DNA topoisomerase IB [Rhodanobacteraceae bacterium]|nr:DNA topoisomerase IB [Rhodanobacteraceae bacterium]
MVAVETSESATIEEIRDTAAAAGLVYVADDTPGIARRRAGKGFLYLDTALHRIRDAAVLERIRALAIPPAYSRVWICPNPRGHLQATGRDARGRKQYRYHSKWRQARDVGKFAKLVRFGERLPHLRRILRRDLALPGLPDAKVLAVVVSLLAETGIRVGNEEYARSNGSYGLTTLRDRHVSFLREGRAILRFRGKSGKEHEARVDNARLVRLMRRCQQLPGQMLFQYLDDEGARRPIDSGMVNLYLREVMGEEFTAKDFRTWAGTINAIALLSRTPLCDDDDDRAATAAIAGVVKEVAARLRNTPAVCRSSYIDPRVFQAWRSGRLHKTVAPETAKAPRKLETIALKLLRREPAMRKRSRPAA